MYYKFTFPNKFTKYFSLIKTFIALFIIDCGVTLLVDILLFLPVLYVTEELYVLIMNVDEVPSSYLYFCFIGIVLLELVVIIATEIKRRFVYCKFEPKGIYIYNNNFARFGYGKPFKMNVTIPYNKINSCYIANGNFVQKDYRYWIYNKIKKAFNRDEYDYMPVIACGDYNNDCIILELKNRNGIVIPIEDCQQFLDEYKSRTNEID